MNLVSIISTISMAFVMIFVMKYLLEKKVNETESLIPEIFKINMLSTNIAHSGVYIGMLIGAMGVMSSSLLEQVLNQVLLFVFMIGAIIISDKIIYRKINNSRELLLGNMSLGFSELGLFIGTGIIAYASFEGHGPWYSSILFFMLGQAVFLSVIYGYNKLYKNILEEIHLNNVSAGIFLGATMIGVAFVLKSAILGDFVSWSEDLQSFALSSFVGLVLYFIIADFIIDLIFLPKAKIEEIIKEQVLHNVIKISALKIGVALLINAAL